MTILRGARGGDGAAPRRLRCRFEGAAHAPAHQPMNECTVSAEESKK